MGPTPLEAAAARDRDPAGSENRAVDSLNSILRRQLPAYSPVSFRALILGSTAWLRAGSAHATGLLETELVARQGARQVLLTDTGTSALTLAIAAVLDRKPGGRVALPAYGCYDVATAAWGAGASTILYDLDPGTLGPDYESLAAAVAHGAAVVVVAHLFGMPVDVARVRDLCAASGAVVVEDAAQAGGGTLGGRVIGTTGSLSILSFGRGKGTTGGGGGALVANDSAGVRLLEAVRHRIDGPAGTNGLLSLWAQWLLGRPALYHLPASLPFLKLGETIFRSPKPPLGMSRTVAQVLLANLPLSDAEVAVRRRNAARLGRGMALNRQLSAIDAVSGAVPGYLRFAVVADAKARALLLTKAAARLGVMPGYPRLLSQLEGFQGRSVGLGRPLPGAERLVTGLFTLPTHSLLAERDMVQLEQLILSAG